MSTTSRPSCNLLPNRERSLSKQKWPWPLSTTTLRHSPTAIPVLLLHAYMLREQRHLHLHGYIVVFLSLVFNFKCYSVGIHHVDAISSLQDHCLQCRQCSPSKHVLALRETNLFCFSDMFGSLRTTNRARTSMCSEQRRNYGTRWFMDQLMIFTCDLLGTPKDLVSTI